MRIPSPSTPHNSRRRTPAELSLMAQLLLGPSARIVAGPPPGRSLLCPFGRQQHARHARRRWRGHRCRRWGRQRHRRTRYRRRWHRPRRPHRITRQSGVGRHRGRGLGWSGFRARAAGRQARFGVENLGRVYRLGDEWVDGKWRLIEVEQSQSGTEKQGAQLARFDRGDVLDGSRFGRSPERKAEADRPTWDSAKFASPNPPTMLPVSAL